MTSMIEALRADEATASWIAYLEELGPPPVPVTLPGGVALADELRALDVPDADIAGLLAMAPTPEQAPEAWWVLERAAHSLLRHMGTVDGPPDFPGLPAAIADEHGCFFVYVFLAMLPHVRAYHRDRGIPEAISRATLADLGRGMAEYRQAHGKGGLDLPGWPMLSFRGMLYQLGRLQFERITLGRRIGDAVTAAGLPYGADDAGLSVHIPGLSGPLTPAACDASFAEAVRFFAEHFPEKRYAIAMCDSWLLDPELANYLPADSNIVRFQRRFHLTIADDPESDWILRFVFGRTDVDLASVPQRTALERAVVAHAAAGRQWHGGVGWLVLPQEESPSSGAVAT